MYDSLRNLEAAVEEAVRRAMQPFVEETRTLRGLIAHARQEYFSIKGAALLTGLSAAHVRRAVVGGTLPCSNVGTAERPTYRISRADLAAWMEKRKSGALPPRRGRTAAAPSVPRSRHH